VQRIGAAPGSVTQTGRGVGVAIVDTGIDFTHPDLNVVATACFTAFSSCADDEGHGTHVSGIVAAMNNTRDVVGVAPDATLFAVKVLDSAGSGSDSGVIAGLDWVAANASSSTPPIRVVNMSLGGPATSDDSLFHAAVKSLYDSGISVVVAAGNDSSQEVSQMVPAGFPEVMAVASTSALTGQRGCFAQVVADAASYFTTDGRYDPTTGVGVTISAPGENKEDISGCWIFADGILSTAMGGGTTQMAGTSMSSPHVAGVAALMYQTGLYNQATSAGPEAIRAKIRSSATRRGVGPLDSVAAGYSYDGEREGIVNAVGAVAP
jgi:subtilisin family serine protease